MARCRVCEEENEEGINYCIGCGAFMPFYRVLGVSSSVVLMVGIIVILFLVGWVSANILRPFFTYLSSQNWEATSCVIDSIKIIKEDGSDVLNIVYSYEYNGSKYTSNDYTFVPVRDNFNSLIEKYPAGTKTICYLHPSWLNVSVINRNYDGLSFGVKEYIGIVIFFLLIALLINQVKVSMRAGEIKLKRNKEEVSSGNISGKE